MRRLESGGLHCLGIRQAGQMVYETGRLFVDRYVLFVGADRIFALPP